MASSSSSDEAVGRSSTDKSAAKQHVAAAVAAQDEPIENNGQAETYVDKTAERRLVRKVDIRLCTIAGLLASLNLIDSNIIGSASVTTMFEDLDLGVSNRYSVSIFIFTIASIVFQLPSTIAVRYFGPRLFFAIMTFTFGLVTLCTAFIHTWREMIVLRVLQGIAMSGTYPGLSYVISTWYVRREHQVRFAYLQTGEVFVLACGGIVNFGLEKLHGRGGLAGWRWMFLVQGLISCVIGVVTYWWMPMLPDAGHDKSFRFLTKAENDMAVDRIQADRKDAHAPPFTWSGVFVHSRDPKVYLFAVMFFNLNVVSTALSYFLPIILQNGMGFSTDKAILLNAPPYYYAIVPVLVTSYISDKFALRGPIITFNSACLIAGLAMLGFATTPAARYAGVCIATGAYISSWAALTAYYSNNVSGQWKRVWTAAVVSGFNGAGGIAGSFIFRQNEAPRYATAIWVAIGCVDLRSY